MVQRASLDANPLHSREGTLRSKEEESDFMVRDTAKQHIDRIREMVAILEDHGVSVRMLKTDRVGHIVYEDEHQVVAEPFSDVQF